MILKEEVKISDDITVEPYQEEKHLKTLEEINKETESLGLEVTRVVIGEITVPEEIKKSDITYFNLVLRSLLCFF